MGHFQGTLYHCTKEKYVLLDLAGVSHQKAAAPTVIEGIKNPERRVNAKKHHCCHPCCSCSPPNLAKRRPTMHTLKSADDHFSPPGCHPLSHVMMPIPISTTPTMDT